jgi:hypothetical protein
MAVLRVYEVGAFLAAFVLGPRFGSQCAFHQFDIRMSVHRNKIPNYNQQDAMFLHLFISTDALHVSGGSSAHHQEHLTVHTALRIANQYCC